MKRIRVSSALFLIISILTLPIFAAAEEGAVVQPTTQKNVIHAILEPIKLSSVRLGGCLPKLGGLFLILVAGALIALGAAGLTGVILEAVQLEKGAKRIKIPEILKKGGIGLSLSELFIEIVFFLVIIATLITALEFYGLSTNVFIAQILSYVPQVIASIFVLILGIFLAIFISGIITLTGGNVRIAQSAALGNTAKYAIIVVCVLVALRELGLGIILTDKSKDIILAGLVLALSLSFGLGAKEKAGKFLNKIFKE